MHYLISENLIEKTKLQIIRVGISEKIQPKLLRQYLLPFWIITYFDDPAEIHFDDKSYVMPANSFFIRKPDKDYLYGNKNIQWKHSWLTCAGTWIDEMIGNLKINIEEPIILTKKSIINKYLYMIIEEHFANKNPNMEIIKNILKIFFLEIEREINDKNSNRIPERMIKTQKYINENLSRELSLKKVAKTANLSISHFCKEFKEVFNIAPNEYIIKCRIQHAKYLLKSSNLSINEISEEVGYKSVYHFSRIFKKNSNFTPSEYRKK